ncbi:MAG: LLM class flavin-dependent oxidoreductase [Actinobacteria bacterium]|nr:LLM class flavin-dependent oxidoreductase [Actinomycetota bacterium]
MRIPVSVTLPQFTGDPDTVPAAAVRAESLGFDGVFLFDHLFPLDDRDRPIVESFVVLGSVVAATHEIRVGTLVLRAPMRNPEAAARAVLTAQALGGGRVTCGLGTGDSLSRPEFDAYGITFGSVEERLSMVSETIEAIRRRELPVSDRVPIWVGGTSRAVQDLAARSADGWNVWAAEADWLARRRHDAPVAGTISWGGQVLLARDDADLADAVARRGSTRGVMTGTVASLPGKLRRLADAGIDEFVLSLLGNTWDLFAAEVLPLL